MAAACTFVNYLHCYSPQNRLFSMLLQTLVPECDAAMFYDCTLKKCCFNVFLGTTDLMVHCIPMSLSTLIILRGYYVQRTMFCTYIFQCSPLISHPECIFGYTVITLCIDLITMCSKCITTFELCTEHLPLSMYNANLPIYILPISNF